MRISILVAVSENGVIGRDGRLPWRLSDDLRRFKRLSMGHTIVMGRRTWESIARPLPGRRMIVVSRQAGYGIDAKDVAVATSLDEALQMAEAAGDDEAFVVGGAELYRAAMPRADRLYLTLVQENVEGDTYFSPDINWNDWVMLECQDHVADSQNEFPYQFLVLQRCEPKADSGRQS